MARDVVGPGSDLAGAPFRELGHAEITATTPNFSTGTDIAGLSYTFRAGTNPIWVEVEAYTLQMNAGAGGGTAFLNVRDAAGGAGNSILYATSGLLVVSGTSASIRKGRRLTNLTPGQTYTFKVRGSTTANQAALVAGPDFPAFLRIYEANV